MSACCFFMDHLIADIMNKCIRWRVTADVGLTSYRVFLLRQVSGRTKIRHELARAQLTARKEEDDIVQDPSDE